MLNDTRITLNDQGGFHLWVQAGCPHSHVTSDAKTILDILTGAQGKSRRRLWSTAIVGNDTVISFEDDDMARDVAVKIEWAFGSRGGDAE